MASTLMPSDRMSTVDEHVERILTGVEALPPYDQPLLEALGLPVSEQITSTVDLPGFDNSAMDGYAVSFDDVASASEDHPVHLPVVGEMAAGQTKLFALSPGTTVRIMTGAPIPQGADDRAVHLCGRVWAGVAPPLVCGRVVRLLPSLRSGHVCPLALHGHSAACRMAEAPLSASRMA